MGAALALGAAAYWRGFVPHQGPATAPAGVAATQTAPRTRSVAGRVALAPALQHLTWPDSAVVFVFARAVDGPLMPLAVARKSVRDLPFDFVLDDTHALNPALRLSAAAQVVVGVRVSSTGNAQTQPGDLVGSSAPVGVGSQGVSITIDRVLQ